MSEREALAAAVRAACVQAAAEAYEDAGVQGLCAEGRWELALEAIRDLDVADVIERRADREARSDAAPVRPSRGHR